MSLALTARLFFARRRCCLVDSPPKAPRLSQKVVAAVQALDEGRAFKFVASVVLVENTGGGGGLHKGSAALWNADTDSSCVVRWENASLIVVATIFALAV